MKKVLPWNRQLPSVGLGKRNTKFVGLCGHFIIQIFTKLHTKNQLVINNFYDLVIWTYSERRTLQSNHPFCRTIVFPSLLSNYLNISIKNLLLVRQFRHPTKLTCFTPVHFISYLHREFSQGRTWASCRTEPTHEDLACY